MSVSDLQIIAWHGLSLNVPATWNPVRIEGDYDRGSLLLADLSSPRLGVRWRKAARGDPAAWADKALRDELGTLSAAEAVNVAMASPDDWKVARLYLDDEPPGRDVFVGWSARSGRVVEIVYNVAERDYALSDDILPTLADTTPESAQTWSIFGLTLSTPPGLLLQSFALNAGDLSLTFADKNAQTTLRRIGPASLALSRQPLSRWLSALSKAQKKMYRAPPNGDSTTLAARGRSLPGLHATISRRRRLCWAWFVPKQMTAMAIHDTANDRLLIGSSPNESLLRKMLIDLAGDHDLLSVSPREKLGEGGERQTAQSGKLTLAAPT